ncbi:histidine phosphatase family protein [Desulfosediminicola flagellatus]|uniref:histidine phosphatase family protein n=1 Tax=Desulfosediminicola flagellatus TaxID=2569541 RepID=UPI0010AC71E3|nr:histidine phosphatase family protein [Desulfosediminicola flagellatus]
MIIRKKLRPAAVLTIILLFLSASWSLAEMEEAQLWEKLRSGNHFAMVRHALAPGFGDPDTFIIGKCETQRNLSPKGREQARHIGDIFRKNGISQAKIYSSQWCRCLDTAKLMSLGDVKELPVLNSFFENYANETPQTKALTEWLNRQDLRPITILVSHQVNITAFTNVYPDSGEIVIVSKGKDGNFITVGTIFYP